MAFWVNQGSVPTEKAFKAERAVLWRSRLRRAAVVLAIYAGVFRLMARDTFAAGDPRLRDSLIDLTYASILATPRAGLIGTRAAAGVLAFWALPVVLVLLARPHCLPGAREIAGNLCPRSPWASAAVGMVGAHILFGMNYPIDRTGLVLMILFGIVWALAAGNTPNRLLRAVNLLLGALLAIQFATQFHTSYFQVWWYDRSTKAIAHAIEQEIRGEPAGSISIGASWIHQPALEYYRVHDRVAALRPVQRRENTLVTGQNYYVLNQQDQKFASARDRHGPVLRSLRGDYPR